MRPLALALILVATVLPTAQAAESEVAVVGGIDFGFKTLDLDTGAGGDVFSPSFTTINPHVALGYRSFYASLSYDRSISAERTTDQTVIGSTATATVLDYSRMDTTLTLGYRLSDALSLFAGYTKGDNEFTLTAAVNVLIVTDISYTETGPFAGFAYTTRFRDKGSLVLSIGYAQLDGELTTVVRPNGGSSVVKGDATGLSYGLTWSGTLTGSLGYRVGLKATRYETEDPIDITERYTSFFVGITNYF